MEKESVAALKTLTGELAGDYYALAKMTPEQQKQLIEDHFLFRDDDELVFCNSTRVYSKEIDNVYFTWKTYARIDSQDML